MDFRSHSVGAECAHCCRGFVVSRPEWQTQLRGAHSLPLAHPPPTYLCVKSTQSQQHLSCSPAPQAHSSLPLFCIAVSLLLRWGAAPRPQAPQGTHPQLGFPACSAPNTLATSCAACMGQSLRPPRNEKGKGERSGKGVRHFPMAAVTNDHKLGGLGQRG